jgi:drug/metabolite transporter (DMT)-like permease
MNPYLWMLAGSLSFSLMAGLSRGLADHADWRLLALVRAGLMMVIAVPMAWKLRIFPGPRILWLRSVVGSFGMLCTFYSLTHLPVSEAVTLINVYPIWIAMLSWWIGARPSASTWIAVAVGVAGVACVAQPQFRGSAGAIAVALLSSVCTSIALMGLNRLGAHPPAAVVAHFSVVSTAITGAAFFASGSVASVPEAGIARLLGVGALGTLGQVALTRALGGAEASKVSVVGLSQLVFGSVLDRLVFGRRHGALTIAGMLLVAAPITWLLWRHAPGRGPGSPPPAPAGTSTPP